MTYTLEQQRIMESLKLTPKENYLRLLNGELPESVPQQTMGFPGFNGEAAYRLVGPSLFKETILDPSPNDYFNIWGVRYTSSESTGYSLMPAPNSAILDIDDLEHWRDYIKAPKMPAALDWDLMARKDWEASGIDHSKSAAMGVIGLEPFQTLVSFLGFENTFIAMAEEPEICEEILNYMADVYAPICKAASEHYTMDCVYLVDDTASSDRPFISINMFRRFLLPVYKRLTKPFTEKGIPVQYHNCGHCEDFIADMVRIGVKVWDPAQLVNDLMGIKARYGRGLVLAGSWDTQRPLALQKPTEADVRKMVRDYIDRFAADGAFMYNATTLGIPGDTEAERINEWLGDEAYWYTRGYYNR